MRIHPADIPPKRGEIFQKLLLETENLEWVWRYLPIVHEPTETVGKTTYDLQVSSQSRQIRLLALWHPSVRLHVSKRFPLVDFTWNLILGTLIKIFREIPDWLQSSINMNT
jgi:hypothetical protein